MGQAVLSNDEKYTIFKYGDLVLRYRSPYSLEYYDKILKWNNGYVVVMAKYKHSDKLVEEYIDLQSILDDLCLDKEILKSIRSVVVDNGFKVLSHN